MRETKRDADQAWSHLCRKGKYGGDDGATGDVPGGAIPKAGAALGMKVKSELITRGSMGVNFLARYYGPDVWNGAPNSCTDPLRAIGKFHLTVTHSPAAPLQKFIDKAYAYELSDPHTPILRSIVKRARIERDRKNMAPTTDALSYTQRAADGTALALERQYPNHGEPWMEELLQRQCPGIDPHALDRWAEGEGEWHRPPVAYLPPPPLPADVPVRVADATVPPLPDVDFKAVNAADDALVANPTSVKGKEKVKVDKLPPPVLPVVAAPAAPEPKVRGAPKQATPKNGKRKPAAPAGSGPK